VPIKLAPDPLCTTPFHKTTNIQVLNPAVQRPTRTMPSERILICGAGVAGSILAYWLATHDFQVVVVERSKTEQTVGQGLEIEEPALKIVKSMGILDRLNEKKTGEMGFNLVDAQARSCGILEVGGISPTGALELMRGDLTEILYKSADRSANVTYQFETTIHSLRQTQDKVIVDLENRNDKTIRTEEFDLVVGADGVRSRTRQLVMGSPEELNCFKPVGAFVAYFSIPKEDQDWPYSQLCHFTGRRIIWMRPVGKESKMTSVYLIHSHDDVPNLRRANAAGDRLKQKEAFAELYSGLGWETPRVIEQMMRAENFYSDELVQVKLQKWSQNRVVLLGDAAWAPSPFTGEGNQLAIMGAWVLAQELSRNRNLVAFEMYENRLRSYVENAQSIPLGGYAPYILNPQTSWGIWLLRTIFRLVSWTIRFVSWTKLARMLPDQQHPDFDLEIEEVEVKGAR
jgi:2-polyprenyl-6-methoxyphenol hydroxylase-like FAD-dependent oxidoreductase